MTLHGSHVNLGKRVTLFATAELVSIPADSLKPIKKRRVESGIKTTAEYTLSCSANYDGDYYAVRYDEWNFHGPTTCSRT